MNRLLSILIICVCCGIFVNAKSVKTQLYDAEKCEGSLTPYPEREKVVFPDSLKPFYIFHVGRHGARYPAGATHTKQLIALLNRADSLGTITELGRDLQRLALEVEKRSNGRWGALDSLGMAEQRGIANRMAASFAGVFEKGSEVEAFSSYSPRAMMSMFSFLHELDRVNQNLLINSSTGKKYNSLVRFFDVNEAYLNFRKDNVWEPPYIEFVEKNVPLDALKRAVGKNFPLPENKMKAAELALLEYYVIAGLRAMEINDVNALKYFTADEYNRLWRCFNLRQYLQRTATLVSSVPADIALPLLNEMISSCESAVCRTEKPVAKLYFGHAETLMPLLSLLRVPGCNYETDDYETVSANWKDFYVVPMAANFRIVLFGSTSGKIYAMTLLNEIPVSIVPGMNSEIVSWECLRNYLGQIRESLARFAE